MENEVHAVLQQRLVCGHVSAVGQQGLRSQRRITRQQFRGDGVERQLGAFEQDQARCAGLRALPRELGTDGTAGAGDEDAFAADAIAQDAPVELHGLTTEQFLDRHFLQLDALVAARVDGVAQSRHGAERQAGVFAKANGALHLRRIRRRHGDHQQLRRGGAGDGREFVEIAEHRHALQLGAAQGGAIVEQTHRLVAALAAQMPQQPFAGMPRAQHEYTGGIATPRCALVAVFPHAIEQAGQTQQQHQQEGVWQQHTARHFRQHAAKHQRRESQQEADERGGADVDEVGHAGKTPQAAIQAHAPEHQPLHDEHGGEFQSERMRRRRAGQTGEPAQQPPAGRHHREIVQRHHQSRQRGRSGPKADHRCVVIPKRRRRNQRRRSEKYSSIAIANSADSASHAAISGAARKRQARLAAHSVHKA